MARFMDTPVTTNTSKIPDVSRRKLLKGAGVVEEVSFLGAMDFDLDLSEFDV